MKKIKRLLQLITGLHRIHDPFNSYGWKIPFTQYGYFREYGFKRVTKSNGSPVYHDCTETGIY